MEYPTKDGLPNIEGSTILKEHEDVFWEFLGFPPKRDIYFSIDLMPEVSLMSKTPYRMSTPKMKEL
jgi:hypothetical protein